MSIQILILIILCMHFYCQQLKKMHMTNYEIHVIINMKSDFKPCLFLKLQLILSVCRKRNTAPVVDNHDVGTSNTVVNNTVSISTVIINFGGTIIFIFICMCAKVICNKTRFFQWQFIKEILCLISQFIEQILFKETDFCIAL